MRKGSNRTRVLELLRDTRASLGAGEIASKLGLTVQQVYSAVSALCCPDTYADGYTGVGFVRSERVPKRGVVYSATGRIS